MQTIQREAEITFTITPTGWAAEFAHFGESENAAGVCLDSLMAQLAEWIEASPLGAEPYVKAFGCPIRVQGLDIMRTRIEHEWRMELQA